MNMRSVPASLLLIGMITIAGCSQSSAPESGADQSAAVAAPAVPAPTQTANDDRNDAPAGETDKLTDIEVSFDGFDSATFGSDKQQVLKSWGKPLTVGSSVAGSDCHYLTLDPAPDNGVGIAFMIEGDRFARIDVDIPQIEAPGGFRVGQDYNGLRNAFPGRVQEEMHKYMPGGRNMIVSPPDGGQARLIFEVESNGQIVGWHIGTPPQVYYVEGCA